MAAVLFLVSRAPARGPDDERVAGQTRDGELVLGPREERLEYSGRPRPCCDDDVRAGDVGLHARLAIGNADAGDLVAHGVSLDKDGFGWVVEVYASVGAFLQKEMAESERISGELFLC